MPPVTAPPTHSRWWRARWFVASAAVLVVLVAAVLVDLPQHASRTSDIQTAHGLIVEITHDVAACNYAVRTSLSLYSRSSSSHLTAPERATLHGLNGTDYAACSFTSETIVTLATVQEPSSPPGHVENTLVDETLTWCDVDAMHTMGFVSELIEHPGDRKALHGLVQSEHALDAELHTIRGTVEKLDRLLHTSLPQLKLVDAS